MTAVRALNGVTGCLVSVLGVFVLVFVVVFVLVVVFGVFEVVDVALVLDGLDVSDRVVLDWSDELIVPLLLDPLFAVAARDC